MKAHLQFFLVFVLKASPRGTALYVNDEIVIIMACLHERGVCFISSFIAFPCNPILGYLVIMGWDFNSCTFDKLMQ